MDSTAHVRRLRAQWAQGEISFFQFLDSSVRVVASALECHRAAVWVFEDTANGRRLRCLAMHDALKGRAVQAPDETGPAVVEYFRALKLLGLLHAHDVRAHPSIAGLFATRHATDVRSLLGGPLSVNGETYGTVVCTQLEAARYWHATQLREMRQTCSQLSLVITEALRDASLTQPAPLTTVSPSTAIATGAITT
jgi:GAF domain-containing protein